MNGVDGDEGNVYLFLARDKRRIARILRTIERNEGRLIAVVVIAVVQPHVAGGISQMSGIEVRKGDPLLQVMNYIQDRLARWW